MVSGSSILRSYRLDINFVSRLCHLFLCVVPNDVLSAVLRQGLAQAWISHESAEVHPECLYVVLGEDQPCLADDVGYLARVGAHNWNSTGHGLDEHATELLLPVRARS